MPVGKWMLIQGCWRFIDGVSKNRKHIDCNTRNGPFESVEQLGNGFSAWVAGFPPGGAQVYPPGPFSGWDGGGWAEPTALLGAGLGGYPGVSGGYYGGSGRLGERGPLTGNPNAVLYVREQNGNIIEVTEGELMKANTPQIISLTELSVTPINNMPSTSDSLTSVIEPASILLYTVGILTLWFVRRRRKV